MSDIKSSLRDYIRIVFYWRWVIVILFIVIVVTSIVGSFLWPPTYEAAATLLVEQPQETLVNRTASGPPAVPSAVSVTEARDELAKTQSEIIKSRFLLGKVVDELALDQDKEIKEPFKRAKAVNKLQKNVRVALVMDTNLIKISAEDRLATRCAEIANVLSKFYVDWASEARRTRAKGAYSFLGTQADSVEKELRALEDALQNLKEARGVLAIDEQTKLAVDQLGMFDTDLNRTVALEEETRVRLDEVRSKLLKQKEMVITSTDITSNPVVNALKIKLIDHEIRLTELRSRYTEENPMVISARAEIEQVRERLNSEVAKIFGTEITSTNPIYQDLANRLISLETEVNALQAKRKALLIIRDEYSKKLTNLSGAEVEYTRLLRRIKGKEALYMTLLEKQGEAGLTEALESALLVNAKIIDDAMPPIKPIRPKKLLNGILGAIIGLILGLAAAFLSEYWDHSLKTVSQVARYIALPVLGAIPRVKKGKPVPYRMNTNIAEAYHSARTALLKICKERSIKTILITSANNLEGKSTVAANLAMSIAALREQKVLLVDMNLRKPAQHKMFEVPPSTSLSDILRRRLADMFTNLNSDKLNVVTVGESPEDPQKLLVSAEMKYFLKEAKSRFDIVLLDSSSIVPYADSTVLSQEADAVILVIKAGMTRREVVERAREILNIAPEKFMGVILNSVEYVIPKRLYKWV